MSTNTVPVIRTKAGTVVDIVRYSGTNALVKPRFSNGEFVANGKRTAFWAPLEWLIVSETLKPSLKGAVHALKAAKR